MKIKLFITIALFCVNAYSQKPVLTLPFGPSDDINKSKPLLVLGHENSVYSASFSDDDRFIITASKDMTMKIWDAEQGIELASIVPIDSIDWVVTTPAGLFDASAGAMKQLYYVSGSDIIELDQLKERYYEPGLLKKILGTNEEAMRNVSGFNKIDMYPEIQLSEISNEGAFNINLTNQGGGIGKVVVYINGKEVIRDARGNKVDPSSAEVTIIQSIKEHPYLVPGKENTIEVKAYNAEGYLASRGVKISYIPKQQVKFEAPSLFIVASGISDYTGDQIDLKYAAKDAEDMAYALEIGAKQLFGADKTFTYLLTSNIYDDTGNKNPTKTTLVATFEEIANKAKSTDILYQSIQSNTMVSF